MFEFTGLRVLHQDMIKKGEDRVVFSFKYNEKEFSCIFLSDIIPYRLYLTTLGSKPEVFELEIEKGYKARGYLENYKKLVAYLDLKYDPNHIFKPKDFFKALNNKIPTAFSKRPTYTEVLMNAGKRRDIEEVNKIYFCGWYTNPVGKKVRPENLEKTKSAFGDKKAKLCIEKNISSRWTDVAEDEDLTKLNSEDKV
ncbi:DUF6037 family protein [Bhargavaea beijingensis]|uniref:Uncharacterized protein n=1 Tax=Bhargavaea beijingensis TaxID=426756 RepID=A0A1G7B5Z9_9BACL|nr:DUF6037 family protein [Bhargavaea beijingensis]RSK32607.1 hypothetical protein EJA12_07200 [Bhargavaea beijingensis]SDE22509.1 hypothetical protein SAMN04488126_10574 [Bhargavaea beijingensis]